MIFGALEAGGTKMVCSIGDEQLNILDRAVFPTLTPEVTIPEMIAYFKKHSISALGIGTFGPADLHPSSKTYGYITTTPKPGWANTPILTQMQSAIGVPALIDTDVNVAGLAEYTVGAAKGLSSCMYVTIGTGIGAGIIAENNLVHGLVHPELGHMLLRPSPADPAPDGFCPYHKGCLEGLASGPAIEKRWGVSAKELPDDHPAWALEAEYLAQMCANAVTALSPEKIILGGGVMHKDFLFPMIRKRTLELLNGYVQNDTLLHHIDEYIVSPGLKDASGVTGALILAKRAYELTIGE